jgi:type II secretory pathway predicted ATPase ExeA
VLVIDEAQNLADGLLEQVRLLSNLETNTEKLIQIVLTGQPELRDILASPVMAPLRQRIALEHHVQPLREHEVESYLEHRVRVAGSSYDRCSRRREPRVLRDLRRLPAPDQPARGSRAARGLLRAGEPDLAVAARAQGQGDRRPGRRSSR